MSLALGRTSSDRGAVVRHGFTHLRLADQCALHINKSDCRERAPSLSGSTATLTLGFPGQAPRPKPVQSSLRASGPRQLGVLGYAVLDRTSSIRAGPERKSRTMFTAADLIFSYSRAQAIAAGGTCRCHRTGQGGPLPCSGRFDGASLGRVRRLAGDGGCDSELEASREGLVKAGSPGRT